MFGRAKKTELCSEDIERRLNEGRWRGGKAARAAHMNRKTLRVLSDGLAERSGWSGLAPMVGHYCGVALVVSDACADGEVHFVFD